VAQLLTSHLERQLSPEEAMGKAMERLRGAFAWSPCSAAATTS
jgi:glutamine---fructose-6-phosphate transaminase (isomerizing)